MASNNRLYLIQASNGTYYKRDMFSGEWYEDTKQATKFKSINYAIKIRDKLVNDYHIDCSVI